MRQLIEALKKIQGRQVDIYTEHKLFGSQHIQMAFEPETEIGFGLRFKEQIIYIDKDKVRDWCVEDSQIRINSDLMQIIIIV